MKMIYITIMLLIDFYVKIANGMGYARFNKDILIPEINTVLKPFEKCTRRYTVGKCKENVGSVWTYMAHQQNCTERLGCRYFSQGNRFLSYDECMLVCEPLVRMYNAMIAQLEVDEKFIFSRNDRTKIYSDNIKKTKNSSAPKFKSVFYPEYDDTKDIDSNFKWTEKNPYIVDKDLGQVIQDIDRI